MVDRTRLDQMLTNLGTYLGELQRLAGIPESEFLGSPDKVGNAKYHFVIAIECCIDVANHVIASEDLRFPNDNSDSFAVLCESGILRNEDRAPLSAMARFRNRLVHLYWEIDDRRIYEYLQEALPDLRRFGRTVAERFSSP